MSVSASTPWLRSIFPFEQELRTACLLRKHFWSCCTFRTKNIHIPCLFLPVHSSNDRYLLRNKNHEPHAFYRKHFWCFSTFRTKNIHISCLFFLPAHSSNDRYSLSSKNYEPHAYYRKHFCCFSHLERRIYTYLVCFCQYTLATIDISFGTRITNRTRFIESISGVFPHLERRIYTYLVCSFCQRTLATIDIPYRARIMNRTRIIESISAAFTFRTKNIHMSCLFLPEHS